MDRGVLASRLRQRGFKVVEPLKCAGHASIFRVAETDGPDAEFFVAKVVSVTGLDAKGRASAQQEVSLLKGLSKHPNLIAYRESFMEEAGILYIVMSLAEDGDLRRVVTEAQAANRLLQETIIFCWIRQTLQGLRHLHTQGVVHRDLKSSNIFLCEGRRRIRIGDFGISRVLESTAFASSCVGTPAYMSPELMRNERYDFHVDMWALGCVCYELCTLRMPFPASSLLELAVQVMDSEPRWDAMSSCSSELSHVTQRLLRKEVSARPTASALLAEPLFAEGGKGATAPYEEAWSSLAALALPAMQRSPDKKGVQTTVSTAEPAGDSLSSKGLSAGGWTLTPRMPWEVSSRGSASPTDSDLTVRVTSAAGQEGAFFGGLQETRPKSAGDTFNKQEFAKVLETHQHQLLAELRNGSVASPVQGVAGREESLPQITVPRRMQVAETVV